MGSRPNGNDILRVDEAAGITQAVVMQQRG